jgi:hypothetical protein
MFAFVLRLFLPLAAALWGAFCMHRWDEGVIADLKLADARAQAASLSAALRKQAAQAALSQAASLREAAAQQALAAHSRVILEEIPRHVANDHRPCVPYGLVRVLDAAATGADPAALPLPAGRTDASCAPVTATALAARIAANYTAARANAEQLNALQEFLRSTRRP